MKAGGSSIMNEADDVFFLMYTKVWTCTGRDGTVPVQDYRLKRFE